MICEFILASAMAETETLMKTKKVVKMCYEDVPRAHITLNISPSLSSSSFLPSIYYIFICSILITYFITFNL